MREFVAWMNELPEPGIYAVLWIGAALENLVPAVPADTFVALGGFLAGAGIGELRAEWVFAGTWLFNVTGALMIYYLSVHRGPAFFNRGAGRWLLRPHQMERVAAFYRRWGLPAIFFSRFVPGIRAVVPVFAGTTRQGWIRVALPIAIASGLWYGGLVYLGLLAGRNLDALERALGSLNRTLTVAAIVIALTVGVWWVWSRRPPESDD
ncbi:MAG: DedA family protein [Gemmatimonadota bacterium]|nr:DedA family protein [Gemmatimonadota bacterium]